ncbi:hypothetical protein HQ531_01300 [bacterium]|nr:hypothetical protein [bacterium]
MPEFRWKQLTARLGLRNLGVSYWLPRINLNYQLGSFEINYKTQQLISDGTGNPHFVVTTVNHFQTSYKVSPFELQVDYWLAEQNRQKLSGSSGQAIFNLPWMMQIKFGGSQVSGETDWIWSDKQLNWEIEQGVVLFDKALYAHLKIWGRHLIQPRKGLLNSDLLLAQPIPDSQPSDENLHLLNYTIYGQVSTLILAYTDSNILQDPLWLQSSNVSWDSEYSIMTNQLPQSRFRYLSLIWVFDN